MLEKSELLLLNRLADNLDRLLAQTATSDWLLGHMAILLKYLKCKRLDLGEEDLEVVKHILGQVEQVRNCLCPPDSTKCLEAVYGKINQFYDVALIIVKELKLAQEVAKLDLQQARFYQLSVIKPETLPATVIPPEYTTLIRCLHSYTSHLHVMQNTEVTAAIDVLEARFLLRMVDFNTQLPSLQALTSLVAKLCQHQAGNSDLVEGLLQVFTALNTLPPQQELLELAVYISDSTLGHIDLKGIPESDWRRYRLILQEHRAFLAPESSPQQILRGQYNFSLRMQEFTKLLIQECFSLLGPPPHRLCFLMLGSMSRFDMQPYSDFEYALLEIDGELEAHQTYTTRLLKLLEFKISSIGERSLECSGFHLDAEGHPGVTDSFRGTPQQLVATIQADGEEKGSYSLMHANYLAGDEELWHEYQQELATITLEVRKALAQKYLQLHAVEFITVSHQEELALKKSITAPLLYLLCDLRLYSTQKLVAHDIFSVLDLLVTANIIHAAFAEDCKRVLALAQSLRCREQLRLGYQTETELVPSQEELQDAVSLIKVAYELVGLVQTPYIAGWEREPLIKNRVRTLVAQKASVTEYKECYLQLPKNLKTVMLQAIEQFETPESKEVLYWVLGRYPELDGTRLALILEEQQWVAQLAKLFSVFDTQNPARLTISSDSFHRSGFLHPDVFKCLWDVPHNRLQPKQTTGNHLVIPVSIAGAHFYCKFYPEFPGYEIAVERLHQLVIGHGTCKAVLARLEIANVVYPLLISQAVPGISLQQELHEHPTNPLTLDAKYYSQLFLLSLLMQPEDGKPDNYIWQETRSCDGISTSHTLVCIDNDHAFVTAIVEAGWFSKKKVVTKTILYCLDQFKEPLHPEAIQEFLLLDPKYLFEVWLTSLKSCALAWQKLFSQEESISFGQMAQKSLVQLRLPKGLISQLYQQFASLQEILRSSFEHAAIITPVQLLERKNQVLANCYIELHRKYETPKLRFAELAKAYYLQVKGKDYSQFNSEQILSLSFGLRTNCLQLLQEEHFNVASAQQELAIIVDRQEKLAYTISNLESGNLTLITEILEVLQKSAIGVFIARIISKVDFTKLPPSAQNALLELLKKHQVDKLCLQNIAVLTDKMLLSILQAQPHLRVLWIKECRQLQILRLPVLRSLISLRVIDCPQLKRIESIDSRAELWQALKEFKVDSIEGSQLFITDELRSKVSPYNGSLNIVLNNGSLNIVLLGSIGAGKSTVLYRFMNREYHDNLGPTIGIDFKAKTLEVATTNINLKIFDTPGQDVYSSAYPRHIKLAAIIILFIDYYNVDKILRQYQIIREVAPQMPLFVVRTKIDLDTPENREERHAWGVNLAEEFRAIEYFESSAKTGEGVDAIFYGVARYLAVNVVDVLSVVPSDALKPDLLMLLLGDQTAGKSVALERFIYRKFTGLPATVGVAWQIKNIKIETKNLKLRLMDISGQQRYRSMNMMYYNTAKKYISSVILFTEGYGDVAIIKLYQNDVRSVLPNMPFFLVRTKIDLDTPENREERHAWGANLAKELGVVQYFECSAMTGEGVDEVFYGVARYLAAAPRRARITFFPPAVTSEAQVPAPSPSQSHI